MLLITMALPMIWASGIQGSLGLELQGVAALWLIKSLNKSCKHSLSDELQLSWVYWSLDVWTQKKGPTRNPVQSLLLARVIGCSALHREG